MTKTPAVERNHKHTNDNSLSLVSRLKGGGYLTSTASVFLLAVPGLKAAMEEPAYGVCLAAGVAASIAGMFLRWRSHRLEQKEK
jgi:hypothetical protein